MSDVIKSFTHELDIVQHDQWIETDIINPLRFGIAPDESWDEIVDKVYQVITQKMLDSYRSGQQSMTTGKEPRR